MQSTDDIYIRSLSCAEGEVLQKSGPEHFDDHGELAGISSVEWPTIRVAAGDMSSSFSSTFELFPSPPTRLRVQQPGDSSLLPHSEETTPEQSFSSPCTSDSPEAPPCTRRETRSRSQSEPSVRTKVLEWNAKIESSFVKGNPEDGVDMVEAMMDSDGSVPHPASSTYSAIISGFCRTGDFESAFSWFSRLLTQPLSPTDPLGPSCIPPRPDRAAWTAILYFLAERDVPFLNRLFPLFLQASDTDGIEILMQDKLLFFKANSRLLRSLQSVDDRRTVLAFLTSIFYKVSRGESDRSICKDLFLRLLHEGLLVESVEILHHQVEMESGGHQGNTSLDESSVLRTFVTSCTDFILHTSDNRPPCIPLAAALSLAKLGEQLSAKTLTSFDSYAASVHFDAFLAARKHSVLDLLPEDWSIVIHAFCHVAQSSDYDLVLQFPSLSKHSSGFDIFLDDLRYITSPDAVISQLDIRHIVETLGDERTELLLSRFDRPTPASSCDSTPTLSDSQVSSTLPNYTPPLPQIPIATYPPATPPSDILVDGRHSRHIDNLIFSNKTRGAMVAFKALQDGVQNGLFPYLVTLGRLINAFGRLQDLSSAQAVYGYARLVLESPSSHKYGHSQDWLDVEEKMMEACARCGDFELANRHRLSILESGCVPSADAYGAMIAKVKDTDDAKRAWELFEEACRLGSVPNTFLYNTIIAKLSRARKAQHVLQLFHEMVQRGLQPNSVTYGAVICACCRVDDGDSASSLFDKMLTIPNFKPRAAPFNTMIQYFVKTRPDRQRALFYYDSLLAAKVHPTSHTYKLLLDCYGTIQPIDVTEMQRTFDRLCTDSNVSVRGIHWATLIHVWGCMRQDVDRAMTIFDSISTHTSTIKSHSRLPDADVLEAIVDVVISNRQDHLLPALLSRMCATGTPMTPALSTSLVKWFTTDGNIVEGRRLFTSLLDSPHAATIRSTNGSSLDIEQWESESPEALATSSEPSIWEVLIKSEMLVGERSRALMFLQKMQARSMPDILTLRLSRIIRDAPNLA